MTTSTLVCDPNGYLTGNIRRSLTDFGFHIVGDVSTLRAAIVPGETAPAPELVLFDFDAAFACGAGAIQSLRRQFSSAKLVGFHDGLVDEDHLVTGLSAGLDGYVLKDTPPPPLVLSLVAVMAGGVVLSQPMASLLRGDGATVLDGGYDGRFDPDLNPEIDGDLSEWPAVPTEGRPATLSDREQEVLICLLRGDSNKAIAQTLDIKESTVKSHVKAVMRKINVSKRNQVIMWAIQHGILSAQEQTMV